MKDRTRSLLYDILQPRAIVLGFAFFHFLSMLVYVVRGSLTEDGRDADMALYYMPLPTVLLMAALCLWRGKLWSSVLALLLSG